MVNHMNQKPLIYMILGIRPDIIRASFIIKYLKQSRKINFKLIWSGQHYSKNLKDTFFKQLNLPKPDIELNCSGEDNIFISKYFKKLDKLLIEKKPNLVIFLGDTNTTAGSMCVANHNIPIFHIEGCMRSYNWEMPEEKYRTIIDHLSDYIYVYLESYKKQGIAEGIPNYRMKVVGNPIVEIIRAYALKIKKNKSRQESLLRKFNLSKKKFILMTAHRRENVEIKSNLQKIFDLCSNLNDKIIFPSSYRTQKNIKKFKISLPRNILLVDPIGYIEFLTLLVNSKIVITDSGTVVEEACIINIPSIQVRKSTERPEVYSWKSSIKFDPNSNSRSQISQTIKKIEKILKFKWKHKFGKGASSKIIAKDIIEKSTKKILHIRNKKINNFMSKNYMKDLIN